MRIAFIGLKGLPATWTGIEFHVDRLGRGLAARGHDVTAYVRPGYTPRGLREHQGIRLSLLPTIRTKHLDASLHSLLASVHASFCRYDIVHYHGVGPGFFSFVPRLRGRRIVCTVHRLDWQADKWGPLARMWLRLGGQMSISAAHGCIAVSTALTAYIRQKYAHEAVLIPNGVEAITLRPPGAITTRFGLAGRDYILFMGRLSPEKRIDWLIRSFMELSADGQARSLRLVIAGGVNATDDYLADLKELAAGNPRIQFTGFVAGDEKDELLSNSLVFALPSRVEGLPVVLLEAMAHGACCVASDIAPHREVLQDGIDGRLFDHQSRRSLTDALQEILSSPEQAATYGENARARMSKHISWDEVVAQTERLYQDVLGKELA